MRIKSNLQLARELKTQFNQIKNQHHSRGRVELAQSNVKVMLSAQKVSNEMAQNVHKLTQCIVHQAAQIDQIAKLINETDNNNANKIKGQ